MKRIPLSTDSSICLTTVIGVGAAGFVPIAFVDGNHFAGVAGEGAIGEEVGRVGEDEVDGGWREGGKDFEAIALVEAEVVGGVVEGGSRERYGHRFKSEEQVPRRARKGRSARSG